MALKIFFVNFADSIFSQSFLQRVASERGGRPHLTKLSIDASCPGSPITHPSCNTTILILVLHAGSVLDANVDLTAKKSDITTFRGAFESVMRQHYPSMVGHITIKLVSCSSICTEGLGILSRYRNSIFCLLKITSRMICHQAFIDNSTYFCIING